MVLLYSASGEVVIFWMKDSWRAHLHNLSLGLGVHYTSNSRALDRSLARMDVLLWHENKLTADHGFAYVMASKHLLHVQNCGMIKFWESKLQHKECLQDFGYWLIKSSWNVSQPDALPASYFVMEDAILIFSLSLFSSEDVTNILKCNSSWIHLRIIKWTSVYIIINDNLWSLFVYKKWFPC